MLLLLLLSGFATVIVDKLLDQLCYIRHLQVHVAILYFASDHEAYQGHAGLLH